VSDPKGGGGLGGSFCVRENWLMERTAFRRQFAAATTTTNLPREGYVCVRVYMVMVEGERKKGDDDLKKK